jgi:hypothetical protein
LPLAGEVVDLPSSAPVDVTSELKPSSNPGRRHHENRLEPGVSAPPEPVTEGDDKVKRCGMPAQPQKPGSNTDSDNRTSRASGGHRMAFPFASTSFDLPSRFIESESLRIRPH